jgi:two-component system LytT family response regulator/two-component system response regulator AlgR
MSTERLKVAVAEDEPYNLKRLMRLLEEQGCDVMASFEDGSSVLTWLQGSPKVDALFLDIRMPGASGMEILETGRNLPPVVFVTAFSDHAVEAFDLAAADYLLKPVRAERLATCLERLRTRTWTTVAPPPAAPRKVTRYPVKAGEGLVFMELSRTTHFEVEQEVVYAHAGQRCPTPWKTLAEAEQYLLGAGLLRIHRHLLVRPEAILGVKPLWGGRLLVTLPGGVELETSRGATPRLKERLGLA